MIDTIIDIFHGDATDLAKVQKQDGIIAVIHKATQGANFTDSSYSARKKQAKDLGLLWGAYHFGTADHVEAQVDHFLSTADADEDVLIALDFEENPHGPDMTIAPWPPVQYLWSSKGTPWRRSFDFVGRLNSTIVQDGV